MQPYSTCFHPRHEEKKLFLVEQTRKLSCFYFGLRLGGVGFRRWRLLSYVTQKRRGETRLETMSPKTLLTTRARHATNNDEAWQQPRGGECGEVVGSAIFLGLGTNGSFPVFLTWDLALRGVDFHVPYHRAEWIFSYLFWRRRSGGSLYLLLNRTCGFDRSLVCGGEGTMGDDEVFPLLKKVYSYCSSMLSLKSMSSHVHHICTCEVSFSACLSV